MENKSINNYSELLVRLKELKSEKEQQEIVLIHTFSDFIASINVFSFFKSPKKSTEFQSNDLIKNGLSMTVNLLAGLMLGKHRSIKGLLSTLMVEQFTKMIIDNNLISVVANIGSMFFNKKAAVEPE